MTYVKSRRRWYGTLAQRFRPLRDLPQGVASIRFTVSWERNPNNAPPNQHNGDLWRAYVQEKYEHP
mgnify:FL=1